MIERRALWRSLLACALAALAMACPPALEPRPPASLSLQIGTRQSCGVPSGLDFDTSCLAAVDVLVLDENTEIVEERCVPLDNRLGELRELVRGEAILHTGGLSAKGKVYFEVRGLHDAGVGEGGGPIDVTELCEHPARADHWLFWGRSALVDLASYDANGGSDVIPIVVDCRDCTYTEGCPSSRCYGCGGFGDACPAALPTSFCTPVGACDKSCAEDADCFDGALSCVDERCDVGGAAGGLCGFCNDAGVGCADGYTCVGAPGASFGRCAPLCPDELCPAGTKCTRLGPDLSIIG
ncbi:MAG: hypothetical protein IT383_02660 [Deltaproteobacteria bacterium]|nr:hypothetical protein [Deltaproteobacteria bacterium]